MFKYYLALIPFIAVSILLSFSALVYSASLNFTPAADVLGYGDVYINQMANIPVFTIRASGGNCSGTIRPDFEKPAPAGSQTIAPADFNLASGDENNVWIGIRSTVPENHDFFIKIESTCGTYYKTIGFHCIGYGYINGSVTDVLSGKLILTATVAPGNRYNMPIMSVDNGSYSASGYPGDHWLIAAAQNYTEQMVHIEIQEGVTITYNIQLKPIIPLSDVILYLQLMAGMELSESPTYKLDINDDGKIGIAEAIYALQNAAGAR